MGSCSPGAHPGVAVASDLRRHEIEFSDRVCQLVPVVEVFVHMPKSRAIGHIDSGHAIVPQRLPVWLAGP